MFTFYLFELAFILDSGFQPLLRGSQAFSEHSSSAHPKNTALTICKPKAKTSHLLYLQNINYIMQLGEGWCEYMY